MDDLDECFCGLSTAADGVCDVLVSCRSLTIDGFSISDECLLVAEVGSGVKEKQHEMNECV